MFIFSIYTQDTGGTPSSFTSLGLTADLWLKPEISGIGGDVYSTISLFAAESQGLMKAYTTMSGTSMATPYTAGYAYIFLSKLELTDLYSSYYFIQS